MERGDSAILEKYGVLEGAWRIKNVSMPFSWGSCRSILKGWEEFTVEDGRRINFWRYRWCGDNTLTLIFQSFTEFSCQKKFFWVEVYEELSRLENGRIPRLSRFSSQTRNTIG